MSKHKRKIKRAVKKAAKRRPFLTFIIIVLIVAVAVGVYFAYKKFNEQKPQTPASGEFSVHFFPLGNISPGDSIYIKAGENDILIDAGSTKGSAESIKNYVDKYCEDKVLEYVIVTHSDSDHIAAFTGDNGIFSYYECEVIIDFPRTNKTETSGIYGDYVALRDAEVEQGAKHYTALECWNNQNGASRQYALSESVTMNIMYNYYYEHDSSDENNYSVCTMFTHGSKNFLFTGDLEKEGEEKFVAYYANTLTQVEFFKAGHHGSATSSNNILLDKIKPKICVIPCIAGDNKHQFPRQDFLDRILAVKNCKIYVPTYRGEDGTEQLLNGEIRIISTATEIKVECSNNSTLFQDSDWFKQNRAMPA